jgi:hypothetical protein
MKFEWSKCFSLSFPPTNDALPMLQKSPAAVNSNIEVRQRYIVNSPPPPNQKEKKKKKIFDFC